MAVYTQVGSETLKTFLANYNVGEPLTFKGIAEGVENSNYYLQTTKDRYILTLYERRISKDDLPFFLGLMEHLSASGINSPLPVRNNSGEYLQTINGKNACLISFLEGVSVDNPNPKHLKEVGKALAAIHVNQAGYAVKRENTLSLNGWHLLTKSMGEKLNSISPNLQDTIEKELLYKDQSR